jgi:hypothetical protein
MRTTQCLLIATTLLVAGCDPGDHDANSDTEEAVEEGRNTSLMAEIKNYDDELAILNENKAIMSESLKKARADEEKDTSPEASERSGNSFTLIEKRIRSIEDDIAQVEKARGELQKKLGELK